MDLDIDADDFANLEKGDELVGGSAKHSEPSAGVDPFELFNEEKEETDLNQTGDDIYDLKQKEDTDKDFNYEAVSIHPLTIKGGEEQPMFPIGFNDQEDLNNDSRMDMKVKIKIPGMQDGLSDEVDEKIRDQYI